MVDPAGPLLKALRGSRRKLAGLVLSLVGTRVGAEPIAPAKLSTFLRVTNLKMPGGADMSCDGLSVSSRRVVRATRRPQHNSTSLVHRREDYRRRVLSRRLKLQHEST